MKKYFLAVVLLVALVPCKVLAQFALNVSDATGNHYPTPVNYFKTKAVPVPLPPYNWSSTDLYQIWERLDSICTPSATVYTHYPWRNTDLYQIWLKLDSCFGGSPGDSTLPGWALAGNAGTSPSVEKLGTTDNADLRIVANDTGLVYIRTSGQIGITGAGKDSSTFDRGKTALIPANVPNAIINRPGSVAITRVGFTGVPRSNTVYGIYAGDSLGYNSGYPVSNTLLGAGAGASIKGFNNPDAYAIGGYENTFTGAYTGMFGDTINGDVFTGAFTGQFAKTLANAVHIGLASGRFNYRGINETFVGAHSGENFDTIPDGFRNRNSGFGGDVLLRLYNGQYNAIGGYGSGRNVTSVNGNNGWGAESWINATSGGNNTWCGYFNLNGLSNKNNCQAFGSLLGQFLDQGNRGYMGFGNSVVSAATDTLNPFLTWINNDNPALQFGRFNAGIRITGDLLVDGKVTATGGVDPPYVSYKLKSHSQIIAYSKHCKDDVMQFYCSTHKRMEFYNIKEKNFRTFDGTLVVSSVIKK